MHAASVKKIELEDLPSSAETLQEAFATVVKEFGLTRENCPTNAAFIQPEHLEQDLRNGNLMYGLYVDGEQVGFAQLQQMDAKVFKLRKLAVRTKHRHQGYGKRLLDHALAIAAEKRGKKVILGIIEENILIKNWYLANGFVHIGVRQYPQLPFVVGIMEYDLSGNLPHCLSFNRS